MASPDDLYSLDDILDDMKEAKKTEKDVIMLSPQILHTILFHLQDFK